MSDEPIGLDVGRRRLRPAEYGIGVMGRDRWERHPVFVTRRFPPSVGGMETLAAGVWRSIRAERPDATLIAHGGTNRGLIWWLPIAAIRVFIGGLMAKIDFVLAADAFTNAVLSVVLRPFGIPCLTMVMGLDVTYPHKLYRLLTQPALRRAPLVIAISEATAEEVRKVGVARERIVVMRLGIPLLQRAEE